MRDFDRIRSFILSYGKDEQGRLGELYKDAVSQNVPVIRPDMKELLRLLLLMKRPDRILEVGTAWGFSALFMSECAPQAKIISIEADPERLEEAKRRIDLMEKSDRIEVLEGDAAKVLADMSVSDKIGFDFAFIDAAKAQYLEYFTLIRPMLRPGAVVVSDNVLQDGTILESHFLVEKRDRTIHDRMREYLEYLTHTPGLVTDILPVGDGAVVTVVGEM